MGTWDTGPFDNDTAADFANALDEAEPEAREALIRGVLVRTIDATGYLTEAEEAVAAGAAFVACTFFTAGVCAVVGGAAFALSVTNRGISYVRGESTTAEF
ncbi:DUF4259 domain-containing protein, partial [Streptomyces sp. TR06-5]|uniref:DUF4259 domain-containing protein n=1 Tax=Streptomyces sp. TR06-5 TaxID=3385976 RepID=UPI0039A27E03